MSKKSKSKNANPAKVAKLIKSAHQQGKVSAKSVMALNVVDLGAQINAGLGVDVDDVESSEVVLVTMMPDDSSSIRFAGNSDAVRQGHNAVLDALGTSRQAEDIFVHNRFLNGEVLYPYTGLEHAVRMDSQNYNPNMGTPLYDQTVVLLGTVLAKSEEFAQNGVPCRTVTLLITDGADCHSTRANASHVRALVDDMQRSETHVIAAMGIDDGSTDFRAVFQDMGIPDTWILTPGNSAGEIRRAFQVFSQSAIHVTQGASMSKAGLGGFSN